MRAEMKEKIIRVCEEKITAKGTGVGQSFYAFFRTITTIRSC